MAVFSWIIVGALVGYVTGLIFGRVERHEVLINIAAGTAGAVLGGLVLTVGAGWEIMSFNWTTYLTAAAGALVLVLVVALATKK
jgi:uncharacterized membrane protein YeaQ/YmgE (transglycosylase-associated protein family)